MFPLVDALFPEIDSTPALLLSALQGGVPFTLASPVTVAIPVTITPFPFVANRTVLAPSYKLTPVSCVASISISLSAALLTLY